MSSPSRIWEKCKTETKPGRRLRRMSSVLRMTVVALTVTLIARSAASTSQDQPPAQTPATQTPEQVPAPGPEASSQAPQAEAQGAAPLRVLVGKSLLINTTERLKRVSVTDDAIADAIVVTPTQILVHGRAAGEVSLLIWDELERSRSFDLRVDVDVRTAAEEEKRIFPDEQISVSPFAFRNRPFRPCDHRRYR